MTETIKGGCSCGHIRYEMDATPLIVHCCHCSLCQRQTGTAFALNALIEAERVTLLQGEVEYTTLDSPSDKGQRVSRCPKCHIAVWSEYLMATDGRPNFVYFMRVGALDHSENLPPDVHIHTASKQPWVVLPPNARAYEISYERNETWMPDSIRRIDELWSRSS